ncbi:MAG: M20/M25/M40 family metallo-hydrolase, partial [Duodenibacillus sp.]|nr:M20/M25/M40 family metallo-hydrolase [Duodenibacillus sp.]
MPQILIRPEELAEYAAYATGLRHQFHACPEIGLNLERSAALLLSELKACGPDAIVEHVGGPDVTGTVAVVRGARPGRTIGLRADGDALPMSEKTGRPWASRIPQRMHACGHDGHWAGLLAAVKYLCEHRDFAGTVV